MKTSTGLFYLVVFVGLSLLAGAIGGFSTSSSVSTWYPTLQKPSWNPPNWIFGPMWTLLYILMGIAAWLVWKQGPGNNIKIALTFFFVQLTINCLWSLLFFGMKNPLAGLIDIGVLWILIGVTGILFWKIQPLAGVLFIPYFLWVSFASALNFAIWKLNP